MRIKAGCRRRIQQQETAFFCFSEQGNGKRPHISAKAAKKRRKRKKKRERLKHQRAPLSSLRMLFILLTGLLTSLSSFCKVSLGAHSGFVAFSLWSLHSACIQSSSCIIYECCGCYSDSLIEIVDTSSWNKNNEGTINLSAVNSHLREQHVRFLSHRS